MQIGRRNFQNTRLPQSLKCKTALYLFYWAEHAHILLFYRLNSNITVDEFKRIFYMEWGHRVLGRIIGLVFVGPLAYFALRKKITPGLTKHFSGLAVLLGLQGALGWFMVKSGLEDSIMDKPGAVPRVSQYRLAAHLGAAFVLYSAMFVTGHNILKDWKFVRNGTWSGLGGSSWEGVLRNPLVRSFRTKAWALAGLVFLTAVSGEQFSKIMPVLCSFLPL